MGSEIRIATRSFVADVDGYRGEEIAAGERVVAGHPVCAAYPQHFRTRPVEEELEIRASRIRELEQRDRTATSHESASTRERQEQEELRFWSGVERLITRAETTEARRERQLDAEMLDAVEHYDADSLRADHEAILEGWNGQLDVRRVPG